MGKTTPMTIQLKSSFSFLLLAMILMAFLFACSNTPREEQLRTTITKMEESLENHQVNDFMDHIGEDFSFNQREDRAWIKQILKMMLFRKSTIEILTTKIHIEMSTDETEATATINGLVGAFENLNLDQGRQFNLETRWYFEDGDWQLYQVFWENPPNMLRTF